MKKEKRELPIAVFDSGVGGISVLRELVRQMPNEDFYYCGDSVNAPYGTKAVDEIRRLTLDNLARMAEKGFKGIVVACNTATSAAVTPLRQIYRDIPVVGIEPAVKPAVEYRRNGKVLILATPMTVHGEKFQKLTERFCDQAELIPLGCPGLMEYVEQGKLSGEELDNYLHQLLYPYLSADVDAVVLGCTHYPFVRKAIAKVLGARVRIFDGSEGTAREMKRRLSEKGLLTLCKEKGRVTFEETLPEKIPLCEYLLHYQES